jgi:hypothetical protein
VVHVTGDRPRYPGARPFSDDDLSRRTFFGREAASRALADQTLAHRLVVVYAKSGLGKTSLLNAGLAQRLRDEGFLPLVVRVNDVQRGPLHSVLGGITAAAARQGVEHVPGESGSLWAFFKTAEFWRGDLLLTPVLILDQFEELFTLQGPDARAEFLEQLSSLIRGVPPPGSSNRTDHLGDDPPPMRIVLCLREDYLGVLEEAADRIPQILDHRFRLTPLTAQDASEAITKPAEIDDDAFRTRPFWPEPATLGAIVDYLSQRGSSSLTDRSSRCVEPFHLQLICQRIEEIVGAKQALGTSGPAFTLQDIGGVNGLGRTLRDFYTREVGSLPKARVRRRVRRLCEEYLISSEGRRLSIEEGEIINQLKLSLEILQGLVDRRLLRCDHRADAIYYELSHDALVESVLSSRRFNVLLQGCFNILTGLVFSLPAAAFVIYLSISIYELIFYFLTGHITEFPGLLSGALKDTTSEESLVMIFGSIMLMFSSVGLIGIGWYLLGNGVRTVRRYRRRRRSAPRGRLVPLLHRWSTR